MKTKLLILLIAFFGLTTSCDNDDDNGPNNETTIAGTWDLRNISGGIAGVNTNFEPGLIQWNFNAETFILTVQNNNSNEEVLYDGLESGTYSYELTEIEGEKHVMVEDSDFGSYMISGDGLIIDQNMGADGYVFTFER